ncbi:hypothetical protein ASPZODRAFT_14482 [Penicilliopsis zonata CBS 506.65]|uniref:Uncharacterized protein n=1 Tax=Penicilliopsis zonata CBS 506.65 TaxID=1073090 RepID=A0A1L9SMM0_9EURO|nr:hypothetical protein ASPZODRAFT_14482 [Penicilliopsis zonata CBS 506.65]OJJ48341.1 hypothetical protein ASPZODRAFT_14482 [Penicilliopsis zonata CBS 506.65]
MSGSDERSFYLYGVGEKPEALPLGSLVLEKYWQPLVARHYTHNVLSVDTLDQFAWSSQLGPCTFHGRSSLAPSIGLKGADIANLSVGWSKDRERVVVAKSGARVILKDPESFLTNQVIPNPRAQECLKLWLSAARSQYVLNFKFARRPKIWMLTGVYLLEGARAVIKTENGSKVSADISSSLIGSLSGIPIGGSISLSGEGAWQLAVELDERHVWAAQFRLVDTKYYAVSDKSAMPIKTTCMGLYKDVLSTNMLRRAQHQRREGVELGLEPEEDGNPDEKLTDQDDEESQEFSKRLEAAIAVFEGAPKHFLD